jgi:hypothetical protein
LANCPLLLNGLEEAPSIKINMETRSDNSIQSVPHQLWYMAMKLDGVAIMLSFKEHCTRGRHWRKLYPVLYDTIYMASNLPKLQPFNKMN